MPAILLMLGGMLIQLTGSIVGRVLISLGIGFVAYTGISAGMDLLVAQAQTYIGALPAVVVGMLATMKVGVGLNIIVSALTARLVLAGMTSGTVRRAVYGVGDIRRAGG